ncbi:MAG: hypothetical protein PHW19_02700 [Salinivirgaceae bacterium]|nr:hypothetical protein [Salinivirgaceae bacterium]
MQGVISYDAPANVSLVKNFGSYRNKTSGNPSFSMTLNKSRSQTTVHYNYDASNKTEFSITINGAESDYLRQRIGVWLKRVSPIFPWISNTKFEISVIIDQDLVPFVGIYTVMTSMSSCLAGIAHRLGKSDSKTQFQTISSIALLDSENAARSVYGGFVGFGKSPSIAWSSDKYATQYQRDAIIYNKLNDSILVFESPEAEFKKPNPDDLLNHPYLEARVKHAQLNINKFLRALDEGIWDLFEKIIENEALTLLALLLSSENSSFFPNRKIIDWAHYLREERDKSSSPITFTFDRELRLHILYPPIAEKTVMKMVENSPLQVSNILHDSIGGGVQLLSDELVK